ncbi:MAG: hypothetical protein ACREGH_01085 [Minisyncoccia bacterium]
MRSPALKILSVLLVVFLVLQYVLGMVVNMFDNFNNLQIPGNSFFEKIGLAYAYVHSSAAGIVLELHFFNACFLLAIALILMIVGIRKHIRYVWVYSLLILITLFVAANSGAAFLASSQNDYYSLSMALSFLLGFGLSLVLCIRIFRGNELP